MTDKADSGSWERRLDQEVTKLLALEESVRETPANSGSGQGASSAGRLDDRGQPISVAQLRMEIFHSVRTGMALPADVFDESGVLLLAAGSKVTPRFLQLLRERGVSRVRLRPAAPGHEVQEVSGTAKAATTDDLQTPLGRALDERMVEELQKPVEFRPVKGWRRPRLSISDLKGEARRGVEQHRGTSKAVTALCEALSAGRKTSATEIRRSVTHFVDVAAVDFDLLPLVVAMQESKDEYLYDHCVNVALLSMAVGCQLGLDHGTLTELGLGGMLQDIGMLRVPVSIRLAPRKLTDQEWHEIHRHPLHTVDMLEELRGIPPAVRFIGYHAHERIDGKGYPRRRSGRQLYRYAEIVSIADVYAAMTNERPYRPPVAPYVAAKTVLKDGSVNRFDRFLVRAFLDTVSLFPIGSRVGLSNGATGRVLRANPGLHTRPVVEALTPDGSPTGHIIDLSHDDAPRVIEAT